jgi:exodeoxyribonuclease-1
MAESFYWHDYETWGTSPAMDRPCQFAGLRTDADLNPIGEPLVLFCRPADDLLPHPDACLITGITPQRAAREGLPESDFAAAIQRELSAPQTCGVGYNSMRFDDEVTRFLFYRNLIDAYGHACRNGNSRWDLIDVLRLAHALRPEGIQWPEREPGVASFRLEELTVANGIAHVGAHDALSDVRATVDLARRLKQTQPRLFDYALTLRDKHRVRELIESGKPLLHASQRFPAALGCIAPVLKVAPHPSNPNAVICFDLRQDPRQLLDLSSDEIRTRLFTPVADLPEGVERVPLKAIRVNAAPVLAPMSTLSDAAAARWSIDPVSVAEHARQITDAASQIVAKLREVYRQDEGRPQPTDPDLMLYAGGFFTDADRAQMARLRALTPRELAGAQPRFDDPRLSTLLFRMRARSWPETLSEAEREDWDGWRLERLTDPDAGGSITLDAFEQRVAELRAERADDAARLALLDELARWSEQIMDAAA